MTLDRFTCEEALRRLDDYVDRELAPEEMARVRAHLELCAVCAMEYRFEENVLRQVRQKLRRLTVPRDLMQRISKALQSEPPRSS